MTEAGVPESHGLTHALSVLDNMKKALESNDKLKESSGDFKKI